MSTYSSEIVIEFAKSTQNVCICSAISIFLIILFMMTPLNTFLLSSIFGKVIILILLGYTLYYNVSKTNKFSKDFSVSFGSGNWDTLKTNIICSYIFSFFLLVLFISVIKKMF
jgi:hypothetical protein